MLDVFEEYDTLKDVYYDGVGYANRSEIDHLERYYHDPAMRDYIWKTRKRVENVRDKMKEYSFGMDKIHEQYPSECRGSNENRIDLCLRTAQMIRLPSSIF